MPWCYYHMTTNSTLSYIICLTENNNHVRTNFPLTFHLKKKQNLFSVFTVKQCSNVTTHNIKYSVKTERSCQTCQ